MDWHLKFIKLMKGVLRSLAQRVGALGAVAAVAAVVITGDVMEAWNSVKAHVYEMICEMARNKAGLELNPAEPWSDASVSAALTARSGIEITTVKDSDVLMGDLSKHASGLIQEHTGIPLTNLLSAEQIKADVVAHAGNVVQERTGLNIAGVSTFDEVQKRISEHVRERLAELVADRLHDAALDFARPENTLDDLLAMVYRAQEAEKLRARDVALGTAASLVVAAYARVSVPLKRRVDAFRRRAQNREAQRRFRAAHGSRMVYEKLPEVPAVGG